MNGLEWLVMFVVMIVLELATQGFVTIWFACGSLAAFFAALFGAGTALSLIIFIVVSLVALILVRPLAKEHFNNRTIRTNVETMAGKTGVVEERIDNLNATGRILVDGMEWSAKSTEDGVTFEKDDVITVCRVEGVKAVVEAAKKCDGGSSDEAGTAEADA